MAKFELKLPKMGESVAEATVTNWLKKVGDKIEMDEAVLEIATDKVDSEVPSEVAGTLVEILFNTDDVVQVGQTIAIIETEGGAVASTPDVKADTPVAVAEVAKEVESAKETVAPADFSTSDKFFSPLVKNIAKEEGISLAELETIAGSGKDGRVNKEDLLNYIKNRGSQTSVQSSTSSIQSTPVAQNSKPVTSNPQPVSVNGGDEIVEMDRMRKLISGYMVASVQTSAHVQSFIEVDVTNIVKWRDKVKAAFEKREGEKLTFTPIMMEAVAKALKDFPGMNISVDGDFIIKRKNINLGMAAALPNGNLIVPVIKNADQLNLVGMAKAVNDLGNRAKAGKLKPDDTQGGTYTVTNVGTFGSIFGTPIINQPQVGILALGAIRKVPAVIETPEGDFIGIRQKMFLSHSYDHRVVDGALGGSFVKRVADYLEAFDVNRDF
ncbi:MAG: dihydrolipoamide acetyltransferase family protein [Flavobacterium sp.]|uniref:dihydrolipoamide acetyltransferase family protein n=1 Tax=Flavobacterium sp. TaxID=239 RepID=UPI00297569DA|nr:dihydrolipoamide acetyltransferase family protein [Flavobacterium sp.]TAF08600.1 MAG: 2-oxo acid dehydrogenase subunit E2 [Flavobacteriia bacterium]WRH73103.1 MAG: dihydrolipoamide acetyltransferase family protein [Flavobacterium sp.]